MNTSLPILKYLFFLFIFTILSFSTQAQDTFEILQVDYHNTPSLGDNELRFDDIEASVSVPLVLKDNFFALAIPGFKRTQIDNLDFPVPTNTFYEVDLSLVAQHSIAEFKDAGILLSPGIASDFEDISGEDITLFAALYISKSNDNSRFNYRYGIIFSRQINGNLIIPAFTFEWKPTEQLLIDAMDPLEPRIQYTFSNNIRAGLQYEIGGGKFKLSEEAQSRYVDDSLSELGPYVNIPISKNFIFHAQAGYSFQREVELFEDLDIGSTYYELLKGTDPLFRDSQNGLFFKVGLRLQVITGG